MNEKLIKDVIIEYTNGKIIKRRMSNKEYILFKNKSLYNENISDVSLDRK